HPSRISRRASSRPAGTRRSEPRPRAEQRWKDQAQFGRWARGRESNGSRRVGRMPMSDPDAGFFGRHGAASYDRSTGDEFDPATIEATVDLLARLAGSGRALELGIGTGRIALPLSRRGVPVHGIDLSQPMVDQLRAKPGGDSIEVTIGDFATTRVDGSFSLAYLVYNTIENLTTQ